MGSKGRPTQLAAAVWSLYALAFNRDSIHFAITVDSDDTETQTVCRQLAGSVKLDMVAGSSSPMTLHNNILATLNPTLDTTWWNDRNVCITPGWDQVLRQYLSTYPNRISWWVDKSEAHTLIGAMAAGYLNATGRYWAPNIFPFWFNDLWHMEIDMLMYRQTPIVMPVAFGGLHRTTTRGREFKFWTEVFIQTREQRIQIAKTAAATLGLAWSDPQDFIDRHWSKTDQWALNNAERLESLYGDKRAPDEIYMDAKRKAETLMVTA